MRVGRRCDRPRRGNRVVVLRDLVTELKGPKATKSRRVRSQKRKGAVAETRCKTLELRPNAARKRGSELREAKQVDALNDVGLQL
jgi:hypothetical protein